MNTEAIIYDLRDGMKGAQVAEKHGVDRYLVYAIAKLNGIPMIRGRQKQPKQPPVPKPPKPYVVPARAIAMRDEYLAGAMLEEIGAKRGITRERVRQIITKHFGKLASLGGHQYWGNITRAKMEAARNAKYARLYGLSCEEYFAVPRAMRHAFLVKKGNFRRVGVVIEMNLADWVSFWKQDGRFDQYGRKRGALGVELIDVEKPFAIANIKAVPHNGSHLVEWNKINVRPKPGMSTKPKFSPKPKPDPVIVDGTQYSTVKEAAISLYGKATAKEISVAFGCTRNVVIGHWFRAREAGLIS